MGIRKFRTFSKHFNNDYLSFYFIWFPAKKYIYSFSKANHRI